MKILLSKIFHEKDFAFSRGIIRIEIVDQNGLVYLLRYDAKGECFADTWHESVADAMRQADYEFSIRDIDWEE